MKRQVLFYAVVILSLQSCTLSKRYHSLGFQIDWKTCRNTISATEKPRNSLKLSKSNLIDLMNSGPVTVPKIGETEIIDNNSSLPIFHTSKSVNHGFKFKTNNKVTRSNGLDVRIDLPSDTVEIQRIMKMKKRVRGFIRATEILPLLNFITIFATVNSGEDGYGALIFLLLSIPIIFVLIILDIIFYFRYKRAKKQYNQTHDPKI